MAIEWTTIIANNIIAYILDQSGIGAVIRSKLRRDPERQAFNQALMQAFEQLQQQHPEATASLFNLDFFKREGGPIVEQFLIPDGKPDPSGLATRWANSLNMSQSEQRTAHVRELERIAADFLNILNHALKAEPALKDINNSRALDGLSHSFDIFLDAFLHKLNGNKWTPGTLYDYLHWLIERNLYLDPRGILQTQRSVQVKLDEVYISLRAQQDETPGSVDRRLLEKELVELEKKLASSGAPTEELEDLREHLLVRYNNRLIAVESSKGEIVELAEAVTRHEKLVVLGDPGSGKTTLLRYLTLKHAQAMQNGITDAGSHLGSVLFPILVRIADYAEYGLPKGKSLSDFLIDYYSMHECPGDGLADLLHTKLVEGNCLILLDGFDEIVSADERRNVVRQIEEFVRRHDDKANRFIITSRIAGYRSAPLGEPFAHYTVQEMDETQIRRFLECWCVAVEAAQTPDLTVEARANTARREIEGIMKAVQNLQGVRRLAANPLLLRILALIHRTGAQLPQKRIELYRLTADTLARTWRMSQGVAESALIKEEYLTPLLGKLAYWLHTNKPTGIATEREVYEVLGEEWASLHDIEWISEKPNTKIKEDVKQFLLAVREHTGLFVERAPKRYGFMHLTFEEYYAARYLVERSRTRARLVREHLHDPHWEEPILLALGFVGLEYPADARELVETAILARGKDALYFGFTPSPYEDLLSRDYLFALRCLGDGVTVRPSLMERLLKRLADELLHHTGSARFWRYRQALNERLEYLSTSESANFLSKLLFDALTDTDVEVRHRAVESLKKLGRTFPEEYSDDIARSAIPVRSLNELVASSTDKSGQDLTQTASTLLSTLNRDTDSNTQVEAILSLGRLGQDSPEIVTTLLNTSYQSTDPRIRQAAIWSLGRLGQKFPEVVTVLLHALHDAETYVRYTSALSLGLLGSTSPAIVTGLLNALQDSSPRVRQEAIRSLARSERMPPGIVPILDTILHQDTDSDVRYVAAVSLGKAGQMSIDVLTILLHALQDAKSWSLRRDSVRLLGEIAQIDEAIIESLWRGLLDENNIVRTSCVEALAQLGRRFPGIAVSIGGKLVQAIEDSQFDKPDNKMRSAHEYAFNGLWLMVVSGEVLVEEY